MQVKCPNCESMAQMAMNTPYCEKCGWNRERAKKRLARFSWLLPALIIAFDGIGIFGLGVGKHDWSGAAVISVLPTFLLGFVYAGVRQGLTRLREPLSKATTDGVDAAAVADAAEASIAKERAEEYDFLVSLPPPRPVHLSRRGKRSVTVLLAFALGIEGFLVWSFYGIWQRAATAQVDARVPEIILLGAMALVASLPLFIRRGIVRDKNLIENGTVALGRVTAQRNLKNSSHITYQFKAGGETVTGAGNDFTRSYFPEMNVTVFYDAQNPKHSMAACASLFEISPAGE